MKLAQFLRIQLRPVGFEGNNRVATDLQCRTESTQNRGLNGAWYRELKLRPHFAVPIELKLETLNQQRCLVAPLKFIGQVGILTFGEQTDPVAV